MTRLFLILSIIFVQLTLTSCTGYGLIYDDKRTETSEFEDKCFQKPDTQCLLNTATTITAKMSDDVARSEALIVLAKTHFQLNDNRAALLSIEEIPILALKFNALFELSTLARKQFKPGTDFLALADKITTETNATNDKLPALLLSSILAYEADKPQRAKQRLLQAVGIATEISSSQAKLLNLRFFKKILPKVMQFDTSSAITKLISLHTDVTQRTLMQVEYLVQLKEFNHTQAEKRVDKLLLQWSELNQQQHDMTQVSITRLLINFNRPNQAQMIKNEQSNLITKATLSAVIIQQLTSQGNIDKAKKELVWLLQKVRHYLKSNKTTRKQQAAQDNFTLSSLRAQAIADVALALAEKHKMRDAVHLAEQIQPLMGHIQGYTLTQLALKYVVAGDVNQALLTMESIHRPVNRAACLAQISADVAQYGNSEDVQRAINIASRVDRQSWRDIANSEISIAQAELNDIKAAMKTLKTIQRSYSAVYAMAKIARTLQLSQNKR